MLAITINVTPVFACDTPDSKYIEVTKELTCEHGVGYTDNPLYFDLKGTPIYPEDPRYAEELGGIPVYVTGQKIKFWMKVTITAKADLENVVMYDRLGGELMLDAIAFDSEDDTPDHYFTYHPYTRNGIVKIDGTDAGKLDGNGVVCEDSENGNLKVYWTGNSVKAHLQWNVGNMKAGEERRIYLIVSTDKNPAGKQEYTSCGTYTLNSGATVKGRLSTTGEQVSAKSNSIVIKVIDQNQDTQEKPTKGIQSKIRNQIIHKFKAKNRYFQRFRK